jgi:SAM-dependent methyltransferase
MSEGTEGSQDLEKIADKYKPKRPAHVVATKVLQYDMKRLIHLVEGPLVLELGYGAGVWTGELIRRFGHSYIVDGSEKLLAHARKLYGDKDLTTFHILFEEFTPPDGLLFNTILATHVLEHLDDPRRVLSIARNWLAKDGKMLVIVPNAYSLNRRLAVLMGTQKTVYDMSRRDIEIGHKRVYDLPALRRDVTEIGYRIVMERGLFLKTLPNSLMTEFPDELLEALVEISDTLPAEYMAYLALLIEPDV